MDCYICQEGYGTVSLAECTTVGPRGVCGSVVRICRACSKGDAEELEQARERWQEEHPCTRSLVHATTAQRYLERGLANLHCARVRLDAAGYPMRARELSERLWALEELHASVKADNQAKEPQEGNAS
jgi:hypothetical protein